MEALDDPATAGGQELRVLGALDALGHDHGAGSLEDVGADVEEE